MRKIPELTFIADNSIEYGAHIAKIIEDFSPSAPAEDENNDD